MLLETIIRQQIPKLVKSQYELENLELSSIYIKNQFQDYLHEFCV